MTPPTAYGLGGYVCPHCDYRGTRREVDEHIPNAHEIRDLGVAGEGGSA
ncbi:MAG: hypothetical protein J4F28_08505 [Nitrosopumilaceae archaeon]|nr:hypothetical protein [Nitrosopumilaceae archaeon]